MSSSSLASCFTCYEKGKCSPVDRGPGGKESFVLAGKVQEGLSEETTLDEAASSDLRAADAEAPEAGVGGPGARSGPVVGDATHGAPAGQGREWRSFS